jgi:hypothetical protein
MTPPQFHNVNCVFIASFIAPAHILGVSSLCPHKHFSPFSPITSVDSGICTCPPVRSLMIVMDSGTGVCCCGGGRMVFGVWYAAPRLAGSFGDSWCRGCRSDGVSTGARGTLLLEPEGLCSVLPEGLCVVVPEGLCSVVPEGLCFGVPEGLCAVVPEGLCARGTLCGSARRTLFGFARGTLFGCARRTLFGDARRTLFGGARRTLCWVGVRGLCGDV